MLINVINNLTTEQRRELYSKGVPHTRMSEWRNGRRLPTYKQCVTLAEITGCNLENLLVEVALNDATEAQKKKFNYLKKGFVLPSLLVVITTICLALFGLTNSLETRLNKGLSDSADAQIKHSQEYTMSEVKHCYYSLLNLGLLIS